MPHALRNVLTGDISKVLDVIEIRPRSADGPQGAYLWSETPGCGTRFFHFFTPRRGPDFARFSLSVLTGNQEVCGLTPTGGLVGRVEPQFTNFLRKGAVGKVKTCRGKVRGTE